MYLSCEGNKRAGQIAQDVPHKTAAADLAFVEE